LISLTHGSANTNKSSWQPDAVSWIFVRTSPHAVDVMYVLGHGVNDAVSQRRVLSILGGDQLSGRHGLGLLIADSRIVHTVESKIIA
jgi:hypothetical protein